MKKVFKMYRGFLGAHFSGVLIAIVASIPFLSISKGKSLVSLLLTLIYMAFVYSAGWHEGLRDSRNVGESVPSVKRAWQCAILIAAIPLLLLCVRVIAYHANPTIWRPYGAGHEMILTASPFVTVTDVLFRLYNYFLIFSLSGGELCWYILPIVISVLTYPIGYMVGLKRFSVIERCLPFMVYKPKDKKKTK